MEDTAPAIEKIAELVAQSTIAQTTTSPAGIEGESTPYLILNAGQKVHDLEGLLPTPTRRRGTVALNDAASFCAFVDLHKNANTRLYGLMNPPRFTAVFNDHGAEPGWRDHMATYACPLSVEWKTWTGKNKTQMSQVDFAQFIEDNAPDCVVPSAADMLEIARSLEAKKKVNFASAIRLDNGQHQFTYEEEVNGTAAKGRLQIPEVFTIGIAVMEGGDRYSVEARLRYRIGDGGKLTMWFDLLRSHKVLEDAANTVWRLIEAQTGLRIFNGA